MQRDRRDGWAKGEKISRDATLRRRNNLEDDTNNCKIDRYGTKFLDKVGAAGREKIGKRYWIDNR